MRLLLGIATIIAAGIAAHASPPEINRDNAFNLCVDQPMLQADRLTKVYEEMKSHSRPPAISTMTKAQFVDKLQWQIGKQCAMELTAHPDVYISIVLYGIKGGRSLNPASEWWNAWYAFHHYCRADLTGSCIDKEVAAYKVFMSQGLTPAKRACSLVLDSDDPVEITACMERVGSPQSEDDSRVFMCSAHVHSLSDGASAGQMIHDCFQSAFPDLKQ